MNIGERMTAFFMWQRYLMKEGIRSKTDQNWKRFRELFLELCEESVSLRYQHGEWHEQWVRDFLPIVSAGKALIQQLHDSCKYDEVAAASPAST
jgi:hypothetical protein